MYKRMEPGKLQKKRGRREESSEEGRGYLVALKAVIFVSARRFDPLI